MSMDLKEIAEELESSNKKVQLIYAFNGTGKTRLSREFKELISPKDDEGEGSLQKKILYYNAFTEDLFYWDNDLESDVEPKLKIQPNSFTDWILGEQGKGGDIVSNFQHYTNDKLMPLFKEEDKEIYQNGKKVIIKTFPELTFSIARGDDTSVDNIKISKGEESNFIWSVFYTLLEQVIDILNIADPSERETEQFDQLEYVFIDDPVSSLDENHLIELAVNLAELIKSSKAGLKFIITTHNPLLYNVLYNELNTDDKYLGYKAKSFEKYRLEKKEDGLFQLEKQSNDSPFSYHLYLITELKNAIKIGQLKKYHFNFLRNVLEKTSTFLGYKKWGELLPKTDDGLANPYEARVINISSHSKHSGEEVAFLTDDDKKVLGYLVNNLINKYGYYQGEINNG